MVSKDPSNADFDVKEATRVLDKIDTMIEKGEVGANFNPGWIEHGVILRKVRSITLRILLMEERIVVPLQEVSRSWQ